MGTMTTLLPLPTWHSDVHPLSVLQIYMALAQVYVGCIYLMILCCIVDVTLCGHMVHQLLMKRSYVSVNISIKVLTFVATISYTLSTIGDIAHCCIRYQYDLESKEWTVPEAYLAFANTIFYFIGNAAFFTLVFKRIQLSFRVKYYCMLYFVVLLLLSVIFSIIWIFVDMYSINKPVVTYTYYFTKLVIAISTIDTILTLSLFVLFLYKIKNRHNVEEMEHNHSIDHYLRSPLYKDFYHDRKVIWNVMIKHSVLFGIVLLSNVSFYIICILAAYLELSSSLILTFTSRALDNTITIIILWLVLTTNNSKYEHICKFWHVCILKYCMKEDPDIFYEGFIEDDNDRQTESVVPLMLTRCSSVIESESRC